MPSIKSVFGKAARLTQKQAALTTLNTVTFPKLYHAIGKRLVKVEKLPADLEKHRSRIKDMEAGLLREPDEPADVVATGLAAKAKLLAKQTVKKAAKISADTGTQMQLLAAYTAMGKEAVGKYGDKVIPKNLKAEFAAATEQLKIYESELNSLHSASRSFLSRAKRAALVFGAICLVLVGAGSAYWLAVRQIRPDPAVPATVGGGKPMQASATPGDETHLAPAATQPRPPKRGFAGHKKLTDEELIEALSLAPDITSLDLVESAMLTDKCIPAIAELQFLTDLRLPTECSITPEGLQPLKGRKLEFVKLPATLLDSPEGFGLFASMIGNDFRASPRDTHSPFDEHQRNRPNDVRALGGWDLYDLKSGDSALHSLAGVEGVKMLGTPANATDAGLASLSQLPDLETLHVYLNDKITNRGIGQLRHCKKLRVLILVDDFSKRLDKSKQEVNRSGTSVNGDCLQALKGMGLSAIELPDYMRTDLVFAKFIEALAETSPTEFGNTGRTRHKVIVTKTSAESPAQSWPCSLRLFTEMQNKAGIEHVEIEHCDCTDEMLEALGHLPDLQRVTLRNIPATGRGLTGLKQAKSLDTIEVFQCSSFSDEGIAAISRCASLRKIHFTGLPQITDEGVVQLGSLANSKHLQEVVCQGTGVSSVGKVKLENLLPDAHVAVFKGASD